MMVIKRCIRCKRDRKHCGRGMCCSCYVMTTQSRESKLKASAKYRSKNRLKINAASLKIMKARYKSDPIFRKNVKKQHKQYYVKNRDKILAYMRAYYQEVKKPKSKEKAWK
jgi:hypothetical protein